MVDIRLHRTTAVIRFALAPRYGTHSVIAHPLHLHIEILVASKNFFAIISYMEGEDKLTQADWQAVSAMKVLGISRDEAVKLLYLSSSNTLTPHGHERLQNLRSEHAESIRKVCISLQRAVGREDTNTS